MNTYRFKNIGPVKDTRLKPGNLTVITGENNSGKTYIAYALYGLLDFANKFSLSVREFVGVASEGKKQDVAERHWPIFPRSEMVSSIWKGKKIDIKLHETVPGTCEIDVAMSVKDVEAVIAEWTRSQSLRIVKEVFATSNGHFKDAEIDCPSGFFGENREGKYDYLEYAVKGRKFHVIIKGFPYSKHFRDDDGLFKSIIKDFLTRFFIEISFPAVSIFTADRLAISILYKELDDNRSRLIEKERDRRYKRDFYDDSFRYVMQREIARYTQPVGDNIRYTRNLSYTQKQETKLKEDLFIDIEQMLNGSYRHANDEILFISKNKKAASYTIPLYLASSSVRGLSDIYFYMKHVAQKGQLLIIDEPEGHLDVKNQILMARLIAHCVNAGVQVLITTHSDYIIKELNNLIMLSQDFPKKKKFQKEYGYSDKDYIKSDSVRSYTCKKGKLSLDKTDKLGMMITPLFDDVIDGINEVSDTLDDYLSEE